MTIQLTQNIFVGGIEQSAGTILTLNAGLEGELVSSRRAIYITDPMSNRDMPVEWALDSSGNPVGLVGPDASIIRIPQILLQCGVPIGIAPTGTMAANGAVTLGTALNATYNDGIWLYYPSGAVYSGSDAGFFWTVMSSTTLGTVYNNIYVPGTNSFNIPASLTAVSDAGPGAFAGVTSEITALSVTVPGGLMGKNGGIYEEHAATYNSSATNKTVSTKLAGTTFATYNATTSTFFRYLGRFNNKGSESRNFFNQYQIYGYTNASSWTTINTAASQTLTITLTRSTATDTLVLEYTIAEVKPS